MSRNLQQYMALAVSDSLFVQACWRSMRSVCRRLPADVRPLRAHLPAADANSGTRSSAAASCHPPGIHLHNPHACSESGRPWVAT